MTLATPAARDDALALAPRRVSLERPWVAAALVFPLALILSWPKLATVWQFGTFFDTDDAMRAVQVRDWMAGQAWFDLTAHRVGPPAGLLIHWSRVVDVPLAILIRASGAVLGPELAERAARIAFPLALQLGMFAATAWVARILGGARAVWPAVILLLLSGFTYAQFQAGRIDHHAPQILLVTLMIGTVLSALDPARAGKALLTGALVAVSLAIGLETLPFIAVVLAVLPLAWVCAGETHRKALGMLAGGLAFAVPLMFVLTVAPGRYGTAAYLSFSIAHLTGLAIGICGLVALHQLSPTLRTPWSRLAAVALVGAAVLLVLEAFFPAALRDPYGGMDPLLKRVWLDHVNEAQPLASGLRLWPDTMAMLIGPMTCGAVAVAIACLTTGGIARTRWLAIAGLVAAGIAGVTWEIRVAFQLQPITVLGGAWVVALLIDLARRRGLVWAALPLASILVFSAVGWAFLPIAGMSAEAKSEQDGATLNRDPRALAPLATLEPWLAFAPIDAGPHLLAYTRLSVLGAPYLNERNNLTVLRGFMAEPDAARSIVEGSGARYVVLCPLGAQASVMAREAPGGLAAGLVAGRVPAWLKPVPLAGTPCRVYTVG